MSATPTTIAAPEGVRAQGHYVDLRFGCTVVVTTPSTRPDLWSRFVDGALRSYEQHDVLSALEYDVIADGRTTSLFFCAVDGSGTMLAGARLQGPYEDADRTHADIEWRTRPDAREKLRHMVAERLVDGVVELKTGWVDRSAARGRHLADMIGFSGPLGCWLLGARYALVTGADHVLGMWQRAGAVVADDVEAAFYPDHRYRTRALWWDLETFRDVADSEHVRRMDAAALQLVHTWTLTDLRGSVKEGVYR